MRTTFWDAGLASFKDVRLQFFCIRLNYDKSNSKTNFSFVHITRRRNLKELLDCRVQDLL